MSLAWLATLVAYLVTRRAAPDSAGVDTLGRIWSLCIPGIAAAFLVGMVRRRVGLGELLYGFGVSFSRPRNAPELRATLAELLRDRDLDVLVPTTAGPLARRRGAPDLAGGRRRARTGPHRDPAKRRRRTSSWRTIRA